MNFVNYDLSKKLKEKGFNDECHAYYEPLKHCLNLSRVFKTNSLAENYNCITAPTISQVLKWLREEKKIAINIEFIPYTWQYKVIDMSFERRFEQFGITLFSDYEEAAIAGIEYCLNNLI